VTADETGACINREVNGLRQVAPSQYTPEQGDVSCAIQQHPRAVMYQVRTALHRSVERCGAKRNDRARRHQFAGVARSDDNLPCRRKRRRRPRAVAVAQAAAAAAAAAERPVDTLTAVLLHTRRQVLRTSQARGLRCVQRPTHADRKTKAVATTSLCRSIITYYH
jgi:hypothetical protein